MLLVALLAASAAAECVFVTRVGDSWLDVLRAAGCGTASERLSARWYTEQHALNRAILASVADAGGPDKPLPANLFVTIPGELQPHASRGSHHTHPRWRRGHLARAMLRRYAEAAGQLRANQRLHQRQRARRVRANVHRHSARVRLRVLGRGGRRAKALFTTFRLV